MSETFHLVVLKDKCLSCLGECSYGHHCCENCEHALRERGEWMEAQGEPSNVSGQGVSDISAPQMSVQDEPSDAAVALQAWRDYWDRDEGGTDEDAMLAALRAVAATEGGER
jgi:NAD(P)H-dependent FMN reductase